MVENNKDVIHGVLETTNTNTTQYARHNYSTIAEDDIDNGFVGYIGDLIDDSYNDTYQFKKIDADGIANGNFIIAGHWCTGKICEDGFPVLEHYYYNGKGENFRTYAFQDGDKFSISSTALDANGSDLTIGNYVEFVAGSYKLKQTASVPSSKVYGKIEAKNKYPIYLPYMPVKTADGAVLDTKPDMYVIRFTVKQ